VAQTGLNWVIVLRTQPIAERKAAKTAMCTTQVNIAGQRSLLNRPPLVERLSAQARL
jgi:hypothetical protein